MIDSGEKMKNFSCARARVRRTYQTKQRKNKKLEYTGLSVRFCILLTLKSHVSLPMPVCPFYSSISESVWLNLLRKLPMVSIGA